MLIVADLSADIPLTLLTSSSFIGGYAIVGDCEREAQLFSLPAEQHSSSVHMLLGESFC
jgi:hypothetical protein